MKASFTARVTVARLALTEGCAFALWPGPTCTAELSGCLARAGSDTSSCGDAWTVRVCPANGQVGRLTKADVDGWFDGALEELASDYQPALQRMLGEARGTLAFAAAAVRARAAVDVLEGRSFPRPEQIVAEMKALSKPVFLRALARPLELVAKASPRPGDVARAREIAVGAVLHLASFGIQHTEYGRPLETLVAQYTARWVEGFEQLRTGTGEGSVEVQRNEIIVLGRILSSPVEVGVSKSSRAALGVRFEID